MTHAPRSNQVKVRGQPLPLHAWFWRRRSLAELQELRRALRAHRDDIRKLQGQMARRVTGIEDALSLLGQAAQRLDKASDGAERPSRQPVYSWAPGKRRGWPKGRSRKSPAPEVPASAASVGELPEASSQKPAQPLMKMVRKS